MDRERLYRMEREAVYELLHYYDKDAKRKWKDRLKKAAGRYVPPDDGIFWDTGLLANGLMELWRCREFAGDAGIAGSKECAEGKGRGAAGKKEHAVNKAAGNKECTENVRFAGSKERAEGQGPAGSKECEADRESAGNGKGAESSRIIGAVRQYFDRWIERGMPVYYLDDTLCGTALLWLYEATNEGKYKAGADRLADYLLALGKTEADGAGSIPYRPMQGNGHVYVDGIGMMCPFLAMYGVKSGKREAVELALVQVKNMLAYGMDAKSGLPYHGFQYEKKEKYGIIGWGRAAGWFLMGMQGVLYWLREGKKAYGNNRMDGHGKETGSGFAYEGEYRELRRAFGALLEAVRPYQREDGGFSWQLEAMEGPADSSATAMIARALQFWLECGQDVPEGAARAAGCGMDRAARGCIDTAAGGSTGRRHGRGIGEDMAEKEKWEEMLQGAVRFLDASERDGRVYNCLGECMGFSQYPQVYGAYPWALGAALEVWAVLEGS